MQDVHLCDLQPEDLSLHSHGGDDRQPIDEIPATEQTSTEELENELLWKPDKTLTEESKEKASCAMEEAITSEECKESTGRPSARERETSATTAGGIADVLGSAGDVTTITTTTTSTSIQETTTTTSPDDTVVVTKMEEAIDAPIDTEQENL